MGRARSLGTPAVRSTNPETFNHILRRKIMKFKRNLLLLVFALFAIIVKGEQIVCQGVLGNSGEQGENLVLFDNKVTSGFGIVFDKSGSLWDRGGETLNRYALDGRLLASYKLPGANPDRNSDMISLLGDTLIICVGKQLYSLSVDAPAGTEIKPMNIPADKLSPSAKDGWAVASRGKDVFLVNAAGGKKPVVTLEKDPQGVFHGPDNSICIQKDWKLFKVVPGKENTVELIGSAPGERPDFIDGNWYGSAWHSTLRRMDKNLQPAPGVVLGGNSGSFIGHVAEQSEVVNGRGLAKIKGDLFAVSGLFGVIHLLEWKGDEKRFEPLRRIGSVQSCDALALDRRGRIWCTSGNWDWQDGPLTPQHFGVPVPEKVFAITMLDNDSLCGYGIMWGRPMIMFGNMEKEVRLGRLEGNTSLPKQAVAVAVTELKKRRVLLILEADGKVTAVHINPDGSYNSDAGQVKLITTSPVKKWTSLVSSGNDLLIGAGDGQVIEFARDGDNWKEKRRWNSFGSGNADKFGPEIFLALDAGKLWVSDTKRSRVVCFDQSSGKPLAEYGVKNTAGNEMAKLNSPGIIAARGSRAALYDSGNQRILKLEIK